MHTISPSVELGRALGTRSGAVRFAPGTLRKRKRLSGALDYSPVKVQGRGATGDAGETGVMWLEGGAPRPPPTDPGPAGGRAPPPLARPARTYRETRNGRCSGPGRRGPQRC